MENRRCRRKLALLSGAAVLALALMAEAALRAALPAAVTAEGAAQVPVLSEDGEKGTAVFRTMQESRRIRDSRRIMDHLGDPDVAKVFALSRSVSNEAHIYEEFIRFRELENGILFSEITPKSQILTCVADHFTDRFPLENWMIYDKTHCVFLIHKAGEKWGLVWGEQLDREAADRVSKKEREYEQLWKGFFESVAITERKNLKCQQNHLPLRYREKMTEMTDCT